MKFTHHIPGLSLTGFLILILSIGCLPSCYKAVGPVSTSGIERAQAVVKVQANGRSAEQNNIVKRVELENAPGSIKHLYVVSAYSGEVIIYSTVQGKVTSAGKRLTPADLRPYYPSDSGRVTLIQTPGGTFRTDEVPQDDGTYGSSGDYLYWFDQAGQYHQHYNAGGTFIHISDKPMAIGRVTITSERADK